MPFSVSAGIGFIALFGIAVLNGIVLIEHLKELKDKGMTNMRELILKGTKDRLRPVMLTAAAAAMGFLPMAFSNGSGAEVQRPLATVVIGGLITSTMLTMIALPLLFEIFNNVTGVRFRPLRFIRAKPLTVLIVLILSTLNTFGQSKALSLDDAITLALENNKELKSFSLRIKEQESLQRTAFSLDKTMVFYGYDENNIAENGYPLKVFGVEQNFNFPTNYTLQNKANKINVSIASVEFEQKQQLLKKEVTQSYFDIIYILNKQKYYFTIDSLYKGLNSGAELSYKVGEISHLDLLNAKAKQQQISIALTKLNHDLNIAYQKLNGLMQYDSAFQIPMQEISLISVNQC